MKIHDSKNLNLPPLRIDKPKGRDSIESDKAVKSLIGSKLLLNKELNELLIFFLGQTKLINRLLIRFEKNKEWNKKIVDEIKDLDDSDSINKLSKKIENLFKERNKALIIEINDISDDMQVQLDGFENKHKVKLNIIENSCVHTCNKCSSIVCDGRFHIQKCFCGKKINKPQDCKKITFSHFGSNIIKFIENNIWLEHGIDYLLRKRNFNTLCGNYIQGNSGIYHEIDNIAELKSDNLRIFCECKNTDINIKDIFIFSGKMSEIGCTRGYFFTTSFETENSAKILAHSKNIIIIEQVLEKDDDDIIKEIEEWIKSPEILTKKTKVEINA